MREGGAPFICSSQEQREDQKVRVSQSRLGLNERGTCSGRQWPAELRNQLVHLPHIHPTPKPPPRGRAVGRRYVLVPVLSTQVANRQGVPVLLVLWSV
jgi:hypothetical protein